MAADITDITDGIPVNADQVYGALLGIIDRLGRIEEQQGRLETELRALLGAWSTGGLRGLRQAAAKGATRGRD